MLKRVIISLLLFSLMSPAYARKIVSFSLKNLENKQSSYTELKGKKLTIIDFWATWCKPCLKSIPKLKKLYEKYKEQGVQFIGISIDSPRNLSKVKPLTKSLGISYPILLDLNSELATKMQVSVVPTLLIINEKDEIVIVHQGYRPGDEKVLEEEIAELLLEPDINEK
jgi:cytochrome c biogenesis protein CcmG/thiol:disulfide interchange protein DsbE